ncbi:hypothetical protein CEXT_135812 [Caerostris extrusa]|uniref:P/Homo B domain-containing protein n=1 Tax=Caerostris extrusa TaxID=172846 RepID=A0AAV4RXD1_CAEEX|nr:hypothetical protein CEXT_135812 [Caerostris extrusa]
MMSGVRIIDGPVTDAQEAMALVHALDYVDIYTASWGPNDDGKSIAGPGPLAKLAFLKGISELCKSFVSNTFANTVTHKLSPPYGALAQGSHGRPITRKTVPLPNKGEIPRVPFMFGQLVPSQQTVAAPTTRNRAAAVIASTYVGGSHLPPTANNIKKELRKIKVVVPEGRGKCRETFQGTSAAAPMAAGVIALLLQANPNLSWRDVQHIIVRNSRLLSKDGWRSLTWQPVKPLHVWSSPAITRKRFILPDQVTTIPLFVDKSYMFHQRVDRLESVTAAINIFHPQCGNLELFLESPSGTISQILTKRLQDDQNRKIPHWEFVSLHFWGETPEGWWILRILNSEGHHKGYVDYFSLKLFGTED